MSGLLDGGSNVFPAQEHRRLGGSGAHVVARRTITLGRALRLLSGDTRASWRRTEVAGAVP